MKRLSLLFGLLAVVTSAQALTAPSNLTATVASTSQINLTWKDNSTNEQGYAVFGSRDNLNYTRLTRTGANVVRYPVTGLSAKTKYYFKVRAFNGSVTSAFSGTVSATTFGLPTPTPTASPSATPSPSPTPTVTPTPTATPTPTPIASGGIAANYPGDKGIGNDPNVLLFEDFESYTAGATDTTLDQQARTGPAHWNRIAHPNNAVIDTSDKVGGTKSLLIRLPISTSIEYSMSMDKYFTPPDSKNRASVGAGQNPLFARWYQKWAGDYAVQGSNHNGIRMFGGNDPLVPGYTPPADGSGWFSFVIQHNYQGHIDRTNGVKESIPPYYLHTYAYWPGREGDHWWADGTAQDNGGFFYNNPAYPDFNRMSCFMPDRNRWYCYEFMLRLNDIGKKNGEIKVWVDGVLRGDWPDLFIRGISNVTHEPYGIGCASLVNGRNFSNIVLRKWHDNVVIAKSYIGPISTVTASPTPPTTPTVTPTPPIGSASVSWDDDGRGNNYSLYYGSESGQYHAPIDCGQATSGRVNNLTIGQNYFFALTASNIAGESLKSKEVTYAP